MKSLLLTLGTLLCFPLLSFSQQEQTDNWMLHVNAGIEAHDKRTASRERSMKTEPGFLGTGHLGLGVRRKVTQSRGVSGYLGLGMAYEQANYRRSFNQFHFIDLSADIIFFQNRYRKFQTNLSAMVIGELGSGWFISGELVSHFLMFRHISNTNNTRWGEFYESTFELEDLQFRLGMNYRIGNWFVGLNSRVVNFQKVDRIIFDSWKVDQNWEWHNPLRFDLTVGYMW